MILNHNQLERVTEDCLEHLKKHKDIRVTSVLSGPSCGKTTLIEALQLASCCVGGFAIDDMSEIMKWHRDEKNGSLLKGSFDAAHEAQLRGDLVDDLLVFAGFVAYLVHKQTSSTFGELRKVVISGLPRKKLQTQLLLNHFPLFRMVYIDCPYNEADMRRIKRINEGVDRDDDKPERFHHRWQKFYSETEPTIHQFRTQVSDRFTVINYKKSPHQKSIALLKAMQLTRDEHNSLLHQLATPESEAWKRLDKVLSPEKYRVKHQHSHLSVQSELHLSPPTVA